MDAVSWMLGFIVGMCLGYGEEEADAGAGSDQSGEEGP